MATDILVQNDLEKKPEKNPFCGTMVWLLADRVKSLIEKKWPGLSNSHMASGGLIITEKASRLQNRIVDEIDEFYMMRKNIYHYEKLVSYFYVLYSQIYISVL